MLQTYRLLAFVSYNNKDNKQALFYLNKGEPLLKYKTNNKFSYLYNTLYGIIYQAQGNYNQSISFLSKNMTDSIPEWEKARTAVNLLEIYTTINKLDSAAYYRTYAEPRLNNIQEDKLLLFGYKVLQEYYSKIGNIARSEVYSTLFNRMQSIIKEQNEAETLFTVTKEFKTNQLDKLQIKYKEILIYFIIGVLVFIMFILFIIKQIKTKRDKLIKLQEMEIEKLKKIR